MPEQDLKELLNSIAKFDNWEIHPYRTTDIKRSVGGKNFWDNLITSTLLRHGITTIYTENAKDLKGLAYINPFK